MRRLYDHHGIAEINEKPDEDRRSEQVAERAEAARERTQTYVTERNHNRDKEMRRLYDHLGIAETDGKPDEDRRSEQAAERAEAARERTQTYVTERNRNRDKEMRRLYDHHRVAKREEPVPFLHRLFIDF